MRTKVNEILLDSFELDEELWQVLHLNRTVTMAVDFLGQSCSTESIEAIQGTLRQQEKMLERIFDVLNKPKGD